MQWWISDYIEKVRIFEEQKRKDQGSQQQPFAPPPPPRSPAKDKNEK